MSDGTSFYKVVGGVKYDRALLQHAEQLAVDGASLDVQAAEKLWADAQDGPGVTKTEYRTLEYIVQEHTFTADAKEFMEAKLHPDSGGKSYYKVVDGLRYDRGLLDFVEKKLSMADTDSLGHGVLGLEDAKKLWEEAEDGPGVTDTERRTIEKILCDNTVADEAAAFLRVALAKRATDEQGGSPAKRPRSEPLSCDNLSFSDCATQLQEWRIAQEGGSEPPAASSTLSVLQRLADLSSHGIDVAILRQTGIGKEVNQRWVRLSNDAKVRAESKALVDQWKRSNGIATGDEKRAQAAKDAKSSPSKKPHEKSEENDSPNNEEMAAAFQELAKFEFQSGGKFKGVTYQRVAKHLRSSETVTDVAEVKGVKGIGPASLKKISEFLESGKIERLEKYKRGEIDDEDD